MEATVAQFDVQVPNWDLLSGRKDVVKRSWVRFEINFFYANRKLSSVEKLVLMFALAEAGHTEDGSISLDGDDVAHQLREPIDQVIAAIESLISKGKLQPRGDVTPTLRERNADVPPLELVRDVDVTPTCYNRQTDKQTNKHIAARSAGEPKAAKKSQAVAEFIAHYCDRYKERYGQSPHVGPKGSGVAKRIVREVGLATAKELATKFLLDDTDFFKKRGHDLVTLEQNLQSLSLKAASGAGSGVIDTSHRPHWSTQISKDGL
jgi:hypothetical protein